MANAAEPAVGDWTAVDLVERFGPVPLSRIRLHPPPGTATEGDVVAIHDHENRLCELVDGVLLEKTVGTYESFLAAMIAQIVGEFVRRHNLGIVLGADGMLRLAPDLVRIPDMSFISWQRLPGQDVPDQPIADLIPDLAVEVISRNNTPKEMERKLAEYFSAGVRQVWFVYHTPQREVRVYTSPTDFLRRTDRETLEGGDVLPGFRLELAELFARPGRSPTP